MVSQVSSTKKKMDEKKANSVSCLQKKYKKLRTMPSINIDKAIKFGIRIFNGAYPLFNSCKILRLILRIHEDYVATTIFTLMLLNGLRVLMAPNFRNRQKKLKRTQAAQTLFVIYIRDSIALRLNHLRECMKMVRKSL